ncbi:MAG: hypothetical protein ACI8RD_012846 [Bacillariaceae sp.]|jgi:hypothetical protein
MTYEVFIRVDLGLTSPTGKNTYSNVTFFIVK